MRTDCLFKNLHVPSLIWSQIRVSSRQNTNSIETPYSIRKRIPVRNL